MKCLEVNRRMIMTHKAVVTASFVGGEEQEETIKTFIKKEIDGSKKICLSSVEFFDGDKIKVTVYVLEFYRSSVAEMQRDAYIYLHLGIREKLSSVAISEILEIEVEQIKSK